MLYKSAGFVYNTMWYYIWKDVFPLGKKENSRKITGLQSDENEQPEIFGRSKTREEIKAERREEKARQAEALKKARANAKAAGKEALKTTKRSDFIVLCVFLGIVILAAAVALVMQIRHDRAEQQFEPATSMSQFWKTDAKPELSEDGLTAAVNRVYYTKGGYLCVYMTLGNGTNEDLHVADLSVRIENGETNAVIGSGATDTISEEYVVPMQDYNDYYFYIAPEHVQIADDPLSSLSYSITATGYADEE